MSKTLPALINPKMLTWARERLNMSIHIAAKNTNYELEKLEAWENATEYPSIPQAKSIAKKYYIPFAALYLSEPPVHKLKIPQDFRRINSDYSQEISFSLIKKIIEAENKRDVAINIMQEGNIAINDFNLSVKQGESNENIAQKIRTYIGFDKLQSQVPKDKREAFNFYRKLFEKHGILVFQIEKENIKTVRAVSIYHSQLPIIIINRADEYSGRTFSLFHELAHLTFHESGIYDWYKPSDPLSFEYNCNDIAAKALMPEREIRLSTVFVNHKTSEEWSDYEIKKLSEYFGTSNESMIRRLFDLGIVCFDFYERKKEQYRKEYEDYKSNKVAKESNSGPSPVINTISKYGKTYTSIVLQAYSNDLIGLKDITPFLDIKLKHLPELIKAVMQDV